MENLSGAELVVYQVLKEAITSKRLYPHSKIVEMDLAKELGISRTPIRAALKQLSYEGLVNIIPNKGAFVSAPTRAEIIQVFDAKKIVETNAIAMACHRITQEEIDSLENCMANEAQTHLERDLHRFNEINYNIHTIIARASGNRYLEKYISELTTKSNLYLVFYDAFIVTKLEESAAYREHRAIIDALRARDEQRCKEEMYKHLENTFNGLNLKDVR